MKQTYRRAIAALRRGRDLDEELAEQTMAALIGGAIGEARTAALLTALELKGASATELAAFARVMRRHMLPVDGGQDAIDTCGTGGSGMDTANTSTMVAFVLAAAGVRVAKHGNRSASGRCGSMDVLERLGARVDLAPEQSAALLREGGLCVLYAPRHHPAMRHVGPVRRQLGFRTVFNLLGPLCNPARVRRQLLGLSDPRGAEPMAGALLRLDVDRALLVHGEDGLDEISLSAPTRLWWVAGGAVRAETLRPAALGLRPAPAAALAGGDPARNATIFREVLRGRGTPARADHLALNAGAALVVAGREAGLREGLRRARQIIDSGAAWEAFEAYRQASGGRAAA